MIVSLPKCGEARLDRRGILVVEMVAKNDLIVLNQGIEFSLEEQCKAVDEGRGGKGRSPSWNTRRLSREIFRKHLEETRLIDKLGWDCSTGSWIPTVRCTWQKVVVSCECSKPRCKRRQDRVSIYWWNDQLTAIRREFLAAR